MAASPTISKYTLGSSTQDDLIYSIILLFASKYGVPVTIIQQYTSTTKDLLYSLLLLIYNNEGGGGGGGTGTALALTTQGESSVALPANSIVDSVLVLGDTPINFAIGSAADATDILPTQYGVTNQPFYDQGIIQAETPTIYFTGVLENTYVILFYRTYTLPA